jgi:SP family sugar:H+ symporter-like MFS transporter
MVDEGPGNAALGAKVFFVWGTCCFFCIIFVYFFVYETKGLTLEQVDELYDNVKHARKSPGYVPHVSFVEERRQSIIAKEATIERKEFADEKREV